MTHSSTMATEEISPKSDKSTTTTGASFSSIPVLRLALAAAVVAIAGILLTFALARENATTKSPDTAPVGQDPAVSPPVTAAPSLHERPVDALPSRQSFPPCNLKEDIKKICQWKQVGPSLEGNEAYDWFGTSVHLSADGRRVAIGGPTETDSHRVGYVRVLERSGGDDWIPLGEDISGSWSGDRFGRSVALSKYGHRLAVGAPSGGPDSIRAGYVRVYEWSGSSWDVLGPDLVGEVAGDSFGEVVSLSHDGTVLAVGASGARARASSVRIFQLSNNSALRGGHTWTELANGIRESGGGGPICKRYGKFASLSADGSRVALGSRPRPLKEEEQENGKQYSLVEQPHAYEWSKEDENWTPVEEHDTGMAIRGRMLPCWHSVSMSSDGRRVAMGAVSLVHGDESGPEQVRIYEWSNNAWTLLGGNIPPGGSPGAFLGSSVALSSSGDVVAIGDPGLRGNHVRVFQWNASSWVQVGTDLDGDRRGDEFGAAVSLSGDGRVIAVGSYRNDGSSFELGHVRVFELVASKPLL